MNTIPKPQPMHTAPKDRRIMAYNPMTGWFFTQFDKEADNGKEWPMCGWDGKEGIWYPMLYCWSPMPEPPDMEDLRFQHLTGKYKHYCIEWDDMAIDETCPEFEACLCDKEAIRRHNERREKD